MTAVVDLAAFARGLDATGSFLDVEGEGELAAAMAAEVPARRVLRHGPSVRHPGYGRRVVGDHDELRALERAATVCDPVGVLLHVVPPGRPLAAKPGLDPCRRAFMELLRAIVASSRLRFDGLYVHAADGDDGLVRACRWGSRSRPRYRSCRGSPCENCSCAARRRVRTAGSGPVVRCACTARRSGPSRR